MEIIIPIPGGFGNQGGWRVLSELSNNWILQGHSVCFLVHKTSNAPYFPTNANILWYGNDGSLSNFSDINFVKPKLKYIGIAYAMVKALNRLKADVVLATLSLSAVPLYLSKIKAKKVYYIQAYEPFYYKGISPKQVLYRNLSKLSYQIGLYSVVNSPFYFGFKGIKSDKYVYPGINFDIFKPKKTTKPLDSNKIILGTIGRTEIHKGTHNVLAAFKHLRKGNSNVELHLAFGDKALEEIEGVKVIHFKGDDFLSDYYNSLDIYICAGTYDLGAVHYPVIEAMACGIPLITTGYLPSSDENAWIVPMDNSSEIIKRIEEIRENPELTNLKVAKALEDVKVFEWDKVSKKMIDIFNAI